MHVANIKPTKKWTKLEDLIQSAIGEAATLQDNAYYTLRNNGGATARIISQPTEPNGSNGEGLYLFPKEVYNYRKGDNNCYIRSGGKCDIHVEEVE